MEQINPDAPSDATIKRLVVDELYWDSRLDVSKIKVEVTDGAVTLTGHVPTAADRLVAEADTRMIRNVVAVLNQLEVDRTKNVPDAEIRANVSTILTWAPDVDNSHLDVRVQDGTVTLAGSVPRYWDKLRARLLAGTLEGVVKIIDEIVVTPSQNVADRQISQDLMRALERRLGNEISLIQVTVKDKIVTLRGVVSNGAAYHQAEEAAGLTTAVVGVRNELRIQEQRC